MRRLVKMVAALLLAMWLPVTFHCLLEALPGFGFLACCQHQDVAPHQDSDCETDSCAVVESGHYLVEDNPVLMPPSATVPSFLFPNLLILPLAVAELGPPLGGAAPPGLANTWQFCTRAVLPIRAPAFLS
jgi:hypothetical protein